MSGKSLDDYTPAERSAYEQGAADTHARYESMQAQARAWLQAVLDVVGHVEAHEKEHTYARRVLAPKLRAALSLDPSVTITHEHDESCGS